MEQPPLDPERASSSILTELADGKPVRRATLLRRVADQGLLLPADALNPRSPSDYKALNLVLAELIIEGKVRSLPQRGRGMRSATASD